MAYDTDLADRTREALLAVTGALPDERRMFGGLCFLIAGNMCCGILAQDNEWHCGSVMWCNGW